MDIEMCSFLDFMNKTSHVFNDSEKKVLGRYKASLNPNY